MVDPPLRSRRVAAFFGGALLLLVLLLGTGAAEWAWSASLARDREAPEQARARAISEVQEALQRELASMAQRGERVAEQGNVQEALRSDTVRVSARAITFLDALDVGPRDAVEIYAPDRQRVAWTGFSFPLRRGSIPDTIVSRTGVDALGRRALVVWHPVEADSQLIGAVRVVRLAQASVPVRNQYLQDYDLSDAWRSEVSRPFAIQFIPRAQPPSPTAIPLTGFNNRLLGWAEVPRPSVRALQTYVRASMRGLAAFWGVVLAGWLLTGLGAAWLAAVQRAEREDTKRAWTRPALLLAALLGAGVASRYALLVTDVPVRWLDAGNRPTALFDPTYLASDVGAGLLRSAGDLAITASVAIVLSAAVLLFVLRLASASNGRWGGGLRAGAALVGVGLAAAGGVWAAQHLIQETTLNTALAFGEHGGVVVDGLILTALGSLAVLVASGILVLASALITARIALGEGFWAWALPIAVALLAAAAMAVFADVALGAALGLATASAALVGVLLGRSERWTWPLTFRGILVGALVTAPLVYGFMQEPLDLRTKERTAIAARVFADQRDRRVSFALDQVLEEARADDALLPAILNAISAADSLRRVGGAAARPVEEDSLLAEEMGPERRTLDELAESLVTTSLLGSLADVATDIRFVSPDGRTLGQYARDGIRPMLPGRDLLSYAAMREQYAERGEGGFYRDSETVRGRRGQTRTAAIGPINAGDGETQAWIYVLTTPRAARLATETPFPRVLAPSELFGTDDEGIAYAEYTDGVLVRYRGGVAPSRLNPVGLDSLETARGVWVPETIEGRSVQAYYVRSDEDPQTVIVARVASGDGPDVLFLLLRLCLAGLAAGALIFLLGVPLRMRAGQFPAQRTRFRDRVLNRFLIVGLASVALTGVVGQQVIEEQNSQGVRDTLRQRLQRAEALLAADTPGAGPSAAAARALSDNVRPDAVAANLGVDVHLYRGADLLESSRRQLVRQSLIEPRLPAPVYRSLYLEGDPYAFADDQLGTFTYTTGYKAIADETGQPIGAIAIPTLPEQ
ncbi:MAG: hypothetical protein AAF170_10580, partial [Bacteroidota bacterium]